MIGNTFIYNDRLDTEFLNSLYEEDTEYAAIVFEQFLHSYKKQVEEIEDSFVKGDLQIFRQKIHKMKPTFSFVGLTQLTEKAAQLEKNCSLLTEIEGITTLYIDFTNTIKLMIN